MCYHIPRLSRIDRAQKILCTYNMSRITDLVSSFMTSQEIQTFLCTHFRSTILIGTSRIRSMNQTNDCEWTIHTPDKVYAVRDKDLASAKATLVKANIKFQVQPNVQPCHAPWALCKAEVISNRQVQNEPLGTDAGLEVL